MSHCIVPNWNLKNQRRRRQQVEEEEEETKRSSFHMFNPCNNINQNLVPVSNHQVADLTWQYGQQLAMHGFSGFLPTAPTKPTCRSNDTLESIVHQATYHNHDETPTNTSSIAASSGGNRSESSSRLPPVSVAARLTKKRAQPISDSDQCRKHNISCGIQKDKADRSECGSDTFYKIDNDATMVTWGSHDESLQSLKTKTTDVDSGCHDGSESRDETGRSHPTRRSRAAAIHNLSERKRRDRINQKMKALQKLVPNASKTDKASMLDEVIEYLKQLQAQVQVMSMRSLPPMMLMPLGLHHHQHLQMSLLGRIMAGMGVNHALGMGMGLLDINAATPPNASQSLPSLLHLPPPFLATALPPMIPSRATATAAAQSNPNASSSDSIPLPDPSCAFLTQSMNMELYSKMAALYQSQMNRTTETASSPSRSNNIKQD
ncbi:hypothetical protein ERO13_A07G069700v2 [Gossypium hirsutum]|uniref:Transcription factor UNE10 n=1 Tax=Gossypium hirsutum TaxID=3635 RepID=A0ABM3C2D1_GOSHI|nr:transcription factor UNE10-like [Gossypium hirsutum]KAG4191088.1 hypothetical protein ERO13_A07G069700v2 [Gossypium hirsutum]